MQHRNFPVIDSHQHFWQLARGDYDWLMPELKPLYQDFLPKDFKSDTEGTSTLRSILVQAAATDAETDFLLQLSDQYAFIAGVVGWIDWEANPDKVRNRLSALATHPNFKGVRPMLQDIGDVNWIMNPAFNVIFERLISLNLSFDALVKPEHLPNLLILAIRYPQLNFVINHCAKPNIRNNEFHQWAQLIREFSYLPNVFIKVSGLMTQASEDQQNEADYIAYVNYIYETFSAKRLMWGSDWPVLKLSSSYKKWFELTEQLVSHWSNADKFHFWSGTASTFYRLDFQE